jgi:hypothetical protein
MSPAGRIWSVTPLEKGEAGNDPPKKHDCRYDAKWTGLATWSGKHDYRPEERGGGPVEKGAGFRMIRIWQAHNHSYCFGDDHTASRRRSASPVSIG